MDVQKYSTMELAALRVGLAAMTEEKAAQHALALTALLENERNIFTAWFNLARRVRDEMLLRANLPLPAKRPGRPARKFRVEYDGGGAHRFLDTLGLIAEFGRPKAEMLAKVLTHLRAEHPEKSESWFMALCGDKACRVYLLSENEVVGIGRILDAVAATALVKLPIPDAMKVSDVAVKTAGRIKTQGEDIAVSLVNADHSTIASINAAFDLTYTEIRRDLSIDDL